MTEEQYGFKPKKEMVNMTEVKVGVNKRYSNGEYELVWVGKKDYLEDNDYHVIYLHEDDSCIFTIQIYSLDNLQPYNDMLKNYGFKLVEPKITITSDTGEKITISKDKAEELGFDVS